MSPKKEKGQTITRPLCLTHPDIVRMGNRLSNKQHGNNIDLNPKLIFPALLNPKRKAHITDAKSPHLNLHRYSSYSHELARQNLIDQKFIAHILQKSSTAQASFF